MREQTCHKCETPLVSHYGWIHLVTGTRVCPTPEEKKRGIAQDAAHVVVDQDGKYGYSLNARIQDLYTRGRDHLVMVFKAAQMGDPDQNTMWDLASAIAHRELHVARGWVSPGDVEQIAERGWHLGYAARKDEEATDTQNRGPAACCPARNDGHNGWCTQADSDVVGRVHLLVPERGIMACGRRMGKHWGSALNIEYVNCPDCLPPHVSRETK